MKTLKTGAKRKEYWRSLEELAETPELRKQVEEKFPSVLDQIGDAVSRRKFLGLMGASLALSGMAGCSRPLAKILPYSTMPEDLLPGVPQSYATVFPFRGVAEGILVTSHEGRPTKIEGNPDHPSSLGATHAFAQASILELYDPDRSSHPARAGERKSWSEFAVWMRGNLTERSGGTGVYFLVEPTASPALRDLRAEVAQTLPGSSWHTYEPINRDNVLEGSRLALGKPLRSQLQLDQADVIVSLESDFLATEPNSVRHAKDFANRRRVASEKDSMNRLYVVESNFSVTGSMADHRLRISHAEIAGFAGALAAALSRQPEINLSGTFAGNAPGHEAWIDAVAADLVKNRGRCCVLVGSSQPPEVHALGHLINQALGNIGPVMRYTQEPYPANQTASIRQLIRDMDAGKVETLFILGGNPVYDAPADFDFAGRLARVSSTIHLSGYEDETSAACTWQLPMTHYLEAWGDGEGWDGTRSVAQPLIAPMHEGKSELEVLALVQDRSSQDGHAMIREIYRGRWGNGSLGSKWNRALHDGLIAGTAYPEIPAVMNQDSVVNAWRRFNQPVAPTKNALEIVYRPDLSTWDGRFANNGWLQELPDNMTKLVWDNAAMMSPNTADQLGLKTHELVTLKSGNKELTIPVYVTPGLADFSLSLSLGYGRSHSGQVGTGTGFNAYALRRSPTMGAAPNVSLRKAGGTDKLVTTQEHHTMDGRPLVREAGLEEYRKEPNFVAEMVEVPPPAVLYTDLEYGYKDGPQWGMSIDLNTCIGCNACAIACQSENNVAIVGKDQVDRGREMSWIRIDRYYTGQTEEPEAVHQPIPCMHCENAPCESVCPVNATSHSKDGLNQMTYNRCIGTRYCNNNCPYKVRRFNYYAWRKDMTEIEKMAMNPDVTVRMRGVMEKCTYCVQRINRSRIDAKNAGRELADGDITTACQQVCPTNSIVFGDIRDLQSKVSQLKAQNRDYSLLEAVNTRPRTTYLAKIRNPNPELEHHS